VFRALFRLVRQFEMRAGGLCHRQGRQVQAKIAVVAARSQGRGALPVVVRRRARPAQLELQVSEHAEDDSFPREVSDLPLDCGSALQMIAGTVQVTQLLQHLADVREHYPRAATVVHLG
jgi:hypothetical protein